MQIVFHGELFALTFLGVTISKAWSFWFFAFQDAVKVSEPWNLLRIKILEGIALWPYLFKLCSLSSEKAGAPACQRRERTLREEWSSLGFMFIWTSRLRTFWITDYPNESKHPDIWLWLCLSNGTCASLLIDQACGEMNPQPRNLKRMKREIFFSSFREL